MNVKLGHSKDISKHRRFRGRAVGLLVLLLSFIGLGLVTARQWLDLHQSDRFLSASLLARSTSDYSRSQLTATVAQVGLGIIWDMIKDSQPDPNDLTNRLASVTAVMLSPVPTATPLPSLSSPQTPTATQALPTLTVTPNYTSTTSQIVTPTAPVQTPTLTSSPLPSSTPSSIPIQTHKPTKTSKPRETNTPKPQNTKKPKPQ